MSKTEPGSLTMTDCRELSGVRDQREWIDSNGRNRQTLSHQAASSGRGYLASWWTNLALSTLNATLPLWSLLKQNCTNELFGQVNSEPANYKNFLKFCGGFQRFVADVVSHPSRRNLDHWLAGPPERGNRVMQGISGGLEENVRTGILDALRDGRYTVKPEGGRRFSSKEFGARSTGVDCTSQIRLFSNF
jgi:hypothetical protein